MDDVDHTSKVAVTADGEHETSSITPEPDESRASSLLQVKQQMRL